ncbi:hypothetical protein LIA77_00395 [Sarocladium implicatum]|nr:hypothetical protein LIA77_00395 [Sarocladium implicatum]
MGMNILQRSLIGPIGWIFMRSVKESGRQLFVWTVNEERWMRWCIRRNLRYRRPVDLNSKAGYVQDSRHQGQKLIDGIITDDPRLLRDVCDRWEDELDGKLTVPVNHLDRLREELRAALFSIMVPIGSLLIVVMAIFKGRLNFFKHGDERRLHLSST